MGRLLPGGAKGPGLFFYLPCLDEIKVIDLRTISFDVPPQEVGLPLKFQCRYRTAKTKIK